MDTRSGLSRSAELSRWAPDRGGPSCKAARTSGAGNLRALLVAFALVAAGCPSAAGQEYTLDDWMTVSSVSSFLWSSDGRSIYFTSNSAPSGTMEIFSIPAEGGDPVQLSDTPEGVRPEPKQELTLSADGEERFPAWTPWAMWTWVGRPPGAGVAGGT